jgi:hypothetical protein
VYGFIVGRAEFPNDFISLLAFGYGVYIGVSVPSQLINQFNTIRITEDGLLIEVYMFRFVWRLVKWEDVIDVKLAPRLDRWGKSQWLIRVNQLTYWHKLISRHHGFGPKPSVVVNSDILEGIELLKIIE